LTSFLRSAALTLAVFTGLSGYAQSSNSDYQIDYAPIMSRGFGVSDEPSMLEQCDSEYSGIRIFEHAAGRPLVLVRAEKIDDGAQITERTFEHGRESRIAQTEISEAEWAELIGLIDKSGFWMYEMDESLWMPDSPTMWIEACLTSQFRSISLYPERTDVAVDIVDFLSDHMQ
jgi:hypothetical protein